MRKILLVIMALSLAFALASCTVSGGGGSNSEHKLTHVAFSDATCDKEGNIEHWTCSHCDKIFSDEKGESEISLEDTVIAKKTHSIYLVEEKGATCAEEGNLEHYACENCESVFTDSEGKNKTTREEISIETQSHLVVHRDAVLARGEEQGKVEHWQCEYCDAYFLDENGEKEVEESKIVTEAPYSLVDFYVEVPANRNPVILQLTDTQIIYGENARPGRQGVSPAWNIEHKNIRCYDYLTEIINAVKPDLIILTGDIVYGEFDDTGVALRDFVDFMETFDIPWAPIFGNHENESKMGADWQCAQFESAENCLFMQRELTGNGNYSVGIAQDGYITRTFYMLDSNGCSAASQETLQNGHTQTKAGFAIDQIRWYSRSIEALKKSAPDVKISFAYHIPQATFVTAYEKYGFTAGTLTTAINIDTHPNKADTDFGQLIKSFYPEWDTNNKIFNDMVELGVDSIFVGHEHCLSASVVYQGVRFQIGQKSSEYDRFPMMRSNGSLIGEYNLQNGATPLIGGSVIPLDENGEIVNPYIYYCGDVFGTNPKA